MKSTILSLLFVLAAIISSEQCLAKNTRQDEFSMPEANIHFPIAICSDEPLLQKDPEISKDVMIDMLAILVNLRIFLQRDVRHHYVLANCFYSNVTKQDYPGELCCYYMPYPGHQELSKEEISELLLTLPKQPFCKKEVELARDFYHKLVDSVLFVEGDCKAKRNRAHELASAIDSNLMNKVCQVSLNLGNWPN